MKDRVKEKIIKYRSVIIMGTSLVFNLISSLLVWHPEGIKFNKTPMTITEYICYTISFVWFFTGLVMSFFDINSDQKRKIKEAILECEEELRSR